jgi:hypothetical protein
MKFIFIVLVIWFELCIFKGFHGAAVVEKPNKAVCPFAFCSKYGTLKDNGNGKCVCKVAYLYFSYLFYSS